MVANFIEGESNIRLTGGSHTMEGRVELLHNSVWSAVCDDDWDDLEATLVCKTLTAFPFDRFVNLNILICFH
jgi:hypothetical protein